MSKMRFTEEQLARLRANPNVEKVSQASMTFTVEFKKHAYEELTSGKSILTIFREAGFDTEELGMNRMRGFKDKLVYKGKQAEGFVDRRRSNYRRPAKTGKETTEQRLLQLENELAYTRQEVEFLKKLQAANMEAQRQWESKHRRK